MAGKVLDFSDGQGRVNFEITFRKLLDGLEFLYK